MKIGIFDSGIGGLTVLKELVQSSPNNYYIYYGDVTRAPYGDKPPEVIATYAKEIAASFVEQGVDLIVVACNTVSAVAMVELRTNCPVRVIGMVEPVLEHMATTNYKRVGVVATAATISSGVYQTGLGNQGKQVVAVACPELVPLIEAGNFGPELTAAIQLRFGEFIGQNIQALILACTHYPIIQDKIENFFQHANEKIQIINPALLLDADVIIKRDQN